MPSCTYQGCPEPATRTIRYPMYYDSRATFTGHYCDEHARAILTTTSIFGGAEDVTTEPTETTPYPTRVCTHCAHPCDRLAGSTDPDDTAHTYRKDTE